MSDDQALSHNPDDWFATLDDVKRFSPDEPGAFIAAIMHEIASCRVVIESYVKLAFDPAYQEQLQAKGIDAQVVINRWLDRLQHLVNFMQAYSRTLVK